MSEDEHSLKAGVRGPTLMEDFHFREKMTHFDHERIPERVVHARGYGVHGHFQVYEPMTEYTRAKFCRTRLSKHLFSSVSQQWQAPRVSRHRP